MTSDAQPRADAVFEISWETCNKVGGIHTVLRSKAPAMVRAYTGKTYILVGPWNAKDGGEFEPRAAPDHLRPVLDAMSEQGIPCLYGAWMASGDPAVVLVDFRSLFARANDLKHRYWERFRIDSLNARYEYDEPLCFATAAGMLVEEYAKQHPGRIIAHCHEWLAGFALLHLRAQEARVATVFTTHATMLGRALAGDGHDLYRMFEDPSFDPCDWAYKLGVPEKHLTEVACAKAADAFTTVSDTTGREATRILGRAPDELTYNGFHAGRFPTFEETSVRHNANREILRDLVAAMCIPSGAFDLDKTLLFITSGRYELRNKGLDVTVRALAKLNDRLKAEGSDRTVVMLFLIIRDRGTIRPEVLERWTGYQRIRSAVGWDGEHILRRIALDLLAGQTPGVNCLFTADILEGLRASAVGVRRIGNAPVITHHISGEENDPILRACRDAGLDNAPDDRVKVLYLPGMADGSDGILNMLYYDMLVGAHLSVFPSWYEPWGYTPLESAALGVPTITTDLAGFGQYVKASPAYGGAGVIVLPRRGISDDAFVDRLTDTFASFTGLEGTERVTHGFTAKRIASGCDWSGLIQRYLRAHDIALEAREG